MLLAVLSLTSGRTSRKYHAIHLQPLLRWHACSWMYALNFLASSSSMDWKCPSAD